MTQKQKGPAVREHLPSHGSQSPQGKSNMDMNTTTAVERQHRDPLWEARDRLTRIKDLNQLMFLAGEGMLGMSRESANAIAAGCDTIGEMLNEVCDLLDEVRS